jgi:membrane-bound ClpP family serine protease
MAIFGNPHPLLYLLLGADVIIAAAVGVLAWRGLQEPAAAHDEPAMRSIEGAMGVAVSALSPEGVVRVGKEEWSAVSLNGNVAIGDAVQVIKAAGVRLEVWGESNELTAPSVDPLSDPREQEGSDTMMPHRERE